MSVNLYVNLSVKFNVIELLTQLKMLTNQYLRLVIGWVTFSGSAFIIGLDS